MYEAKDQIAPLQKKNDPVLSDAVIIAASMRISQLKKIGLIQPEWAKTAIIYLRNYIPTQVNNQYRLLNEIWFEPLFCTLT